MPFPVLSIVWIIAKMFAFKKQSKNEQNHTVLAPTFFSRGKSQPYNSILLADLPLPFLPERDYVTFGSLLSQFRLSSVCLSVVCRLSVSYTHLTLPTNREV